MQYSIYKLSFKTPVHFGAGRLNSVGITFFADTLFSALYKEAILIYGEKEAKKLYDYAVCGQLLFSDAMPYSGSSLFIPKPVISIDGKRESDSKLKKKFKKLKYILTDDIAEYLAGNYNPEAAIEMFDELGKSDIRTSVSVNENSDNEPYNVGTYAFREKNGLYFIVSTENDDIMWFVDELIESLGYTGIGGKRSSGLGKFDYTYEDISDEMKKRLENNFDTYMSLSVSMSKENELDEVLKNAEYELIKRSGFVSSENYSNTNMKKNDFYCFKGGSCFKIKFEGDVFDVSGGGNHSVYRYAKPLMFGVK